MSCYRCHGRTSLSDIGIAKTLTTCLLLLWTNTVFSNGSSIATSVTASCASTTSRSPRVRQHPSPLVLSSITLYHADRFACLLHPALVYSPEMPATIPLTVLIRRAAGKIVKGMLMILRAFLVATIWLMILPYFTIWIWRLYFWIGETFAFRANGLETPQWNATSFFASRHNMSELAAPPSSDAGKAVDSVPVLLAQVLAPEYQWIRYDY